MVWKRFLLTAAAIFIFALVWNSLVHGLILADARAQMAQVWRAAPDLGLGLAATAAIAVLFVTSHAAWARQGGVREGLAHGVFFALVAGVLVDLNQYLLYPVPGRLALAWFAFALVEFSVYGLLASWLYPVVRKT